MHAARTPAGFTPHTRTSPATRAWEPLMARVRAGVFELGVVVTEAHANSRGRLHGGVIATLADNAMGLTLGQALGGDVQGIVTTSLALDYVGGTEPGQWLQITPRVVKVGKSSAVIDALITADGVIVARASANFRVLG
jgi:uncharacterized protein (TIGR00369 family)